MANKILAALVRFACILSIGIVLYIIGYAIVFGLISIYNYALEAAKNIVMFTVKNTEVVIITLGCLLLSAICSEFIIAKYRKKDKNDNKKTKKIDKDINK